MDWFKRDKGGIAPQKKKEIPELWVKCPGCGEIIYKRELEKNRSVCAKCGHHFRISVQEYVKLLADEERFVEFHRDIQPVDFLRFRANKKYADQLRDAARKSSNMDAMITGLAHLSGRLVVLAIMDFSFIGGSMGSVVGEKFSLAADIALQLRAPLIVVNASGGARMMEGALSLMQMAKTSAKLARLADAGVPYISILTHPTTGGVTASYAMLGDLNIGEPGALIGFAGPRVIKQTIGQDLPDSFQTAEFLLQHGFLDMIVSRHDMRDRLAQILEVLAEDQPAIDNLDQAKQVALNAVSSRVNGKLAS
jgi:acetyl-CoA carboxylase carboxyl transferase subunit beta